MAASFPDSAPIPFVTCPSSGSYPPASTSNRVPPVEPAAASPRVAVPVRVSLFGSLPATHLVASVIVPAKNEVATLGPTLAALAAQVDFAGRPWDPRCFEVLVLANNCSDQTAAVARAFAQAHPAFALHVHELTLPPGEAHIGRARRLLMDEACHRLEQAGNPHAFLVSTDADTCVSPTWLAAIQAELRAGNDAVGGRILTGTPEGSKCAARYQHLRDTTYRVLRARLESLVDPDPADPWPRHHQHFGASLALTPQAYRRVGGLPVVPYLEDEALYQCLRRHDLRVRHSPRVQAVTSDRRTGRVAVGLSWQLRQWDSMRQQQQEFLVESPQGLRLEWQARNQLRRHWQLPHQPSLPNQTLCELASTLGVSRTGLAQQLRAADTFGSLWHWVERSRQAAGHQLPHQSPIPLGQALAELRHLIRQHEQAGN
ncbi:glycosyltransferase family 2 protein [Hymenobacter edaphi]|uniref:Glycosyltransferase family 2 protein n=1 Tax=Hymenobacter edaphi TaxID=2211146 RepID=A0A328B4S0_9BACT|nr:glycosyltransferase family 2 protein [Hymenobacter edaphi]